MILEKQSEIILQAVIDAFIDDQMAPHTITLKEAALVARKLDKLIAEQGFVISKIKTNKTHEKRNRLHLQLEQ